MVELHCLGFSGVLIRNHGLTRINTDFNRSSQLLLAPKQLNHPVNVRSMNKDGSDTPPYPYYYA